MAELGIEGRLHDVLTGRDSGVEQDAVVIRSGRVLVLNRMPVAHDGRQRLGDNLAGPYPAS